MRGIFGERDMISTILNTALKANEKKRKYTRIPLQVKARILAGDQIIESELVNPSLNGAFITTDTRIAVNSSVIFSISDTYASLNLNDIKAKVVRVVGNGIGLQFEE
jgi:hypothetical protein